MRSWIRKHPRAVKVDIALMVAWLITLSCFYISLNRQADSIFARLPKERTTRIYLGHNLSGSATAITGATIHVKYQDFISHSSRAEETYFLRVTDDKTQYISDRAYALMPNGHTYSTVIDTKPPTRDYVLYSRHLDKENLVIGWRLEPYRPRILEGAVISLAVAFYIVLLTALIAGKKP